MAQPSDLAAYAERFGLRRVHLVAWRDLEDPEAGGSELHAHRIASEWAAAGLDVSMRTSAVPDRPARVERAGYQVYRESGRYAVFPKVAWEGLRSGHSAGDGLVEIWNGMPFWSPLWYRGPRVVFLHHVHAEMWRMVLPGLLGRLGQTVERTVAPPLYRRSRVVTLSESSRQEIVHQLGMAPGRVSVVPPGVEPRFTPGGERSATPLVVAVGRLVPVKRFDMLMTALAEVKRKVPALRAVIIGEGYERTRLEALRHRLGAADWISLPGHLDDEELRAAYRSAWLVASTSFREGWGMTLTEAAACGTPAVATRIAGHEDAVADGTTGLLAEDTAGIAAAVEHLLVDPDRRGRMGLAAVEHARAFTWNATARATLAALVAEVRRSGSD